jgi:hypothetical protein
MVNYFTYFCSRECVGADRRCWHSGDRWDEKGELPDGLEFWQVKHVLKIRDEDAAGLNFTPAGRSDPAPAPATGEEREGPEMENLLVQEQ